MGERVEASLRDAVLRKSREAAATQTAFFTEHAAAVEGCARELAAAFDAGGRLLLLGNGGSACDAQHMAVEFTHPVLAKRPALPVLSLSGDAALLTAIGNDADFALSFASQVKLHGRKGDVVVAFSTSGQSRNVLRGLQAAREMGLTTVGFTGRDGGRMAPLCDRCFRVESFSIHRIQETHEILLHVLWDLIHIVRGEEDVL
jgi:D-sedoheptulose 7-phosphate isomerase